MVHVRPENSNDHDTVRAINMAAFPQDGEARLVDALRAGGKALVSLVAEYEERVVGHILFSPVTIDGVRDCDGGVGLAPLAVLPDCQNRGIGSCLVRAGLEACRTAGYGFVVVLGEPEYYERFGFGRAGDRRLGNEYGVDDPFMVLELREGALPLSGGLVRYALEFAAL